MYLNNNKILSSQNLDELREVLAKQFIPHELNFTHGNHELNACVHGCAVNNTSLTYLSYGDGASVEARIHDDQCADIITINIPTAGTGRFEQNGESCDISPDKGLVLNMQQPFSFNTESCSALALSFSIETMRQHARSLIGEKIDLIDTQFAPTIDLTTPAGQSLRNAITLAAQEMDGPLGSLNNPVANANLENYLLTQFITLQPNAFMALPQRTITPAVMPYHIKRARDYIHAHAHEKITLQDLSAHAGCSYRTLQTLFNKTLSMSPMAYLKSVRLEGVREALLDANSKESTVSDIAGRWGFVHMGRLAKSYKAQFGILPSETLHQK